jgi:phage gp36-like protein
VSSYASATTDFPTYGLPAAALANSPNITTPQIQATLDAISAEFDGYLAGQYVLPLLSYTTELTKYVCWAAAYELMAVRGYNPEGDGGLLEKRDKKARDWLLGVSKGLISPPGIVGGDGNNEDQAGAADMTSDPLRGWQYDPPNNSGSGGGAGGGFNGPWGD